MEKVIISERRENGFRIKRAYDLFQTRLPSRQKFPRFKQEEERVFILQDEEFFTDVQKYLWKEIVSEMIAIGYKYDYLSDLLHLKRMDAGELHCFLCALIAADLEQDEKYIFEKLPESGYAVDGFFNFRLKPLKEKWRKIIECIPSDFSAYEAERFLQYLVDGNCGEVYVKTNEVYGGNYRLCRRGLWLKDRDNYGAKTELLLSCAKGVHVIGKPSAELLPFIRKYYGRYAVFND